MNQDNNQAEEMKMPNCAEEIGKLPFLTRAIFLGLPIVWILDLFS